MIGRAQYREDAKPAWERRHIRAGLCRNGDGRPLDTRTLCAGCAERLRENARARKVRTISERSRA
jgi:hypothetical protein